MPKIHDNIPHFKGVIATRVKHKCTRKLRSFHQAGDGRWRCSRLSPVCPCAPKQHICGIDIVPRVVNAFSVPKTFMIHQTFALWALYILIARPNGGLFRYHVKRIHFTICKDLVFCPPFWGKIDGPVLLLRKCRHYLISRDLIWIKIVVGKTIYKQIVIILAIRFAVLSTVFQLK